MHVRPMKVICEVWKLVYISGGNPVFQYPVCSVYSDFRNRVLLRLLTQFQNLFTQYFR